MIALSTTTASATRKLIIRENPNSDIDKFPARVQVTKTLDGGVVINHSGVSDGDRPIRIRTFLSEADSDILKDIHKNETIINIAMKDGFFSGAILSLDIDGGVVDMRLAIEEKLSD